jgi:hypothetical protein
MQYGLEAGLIRDCVRHLQQRVKAASVFFHSIHLNLLADSTPVSRLQPIHQPWKSTLVSIDCIRLPRYRPATSSAETTIPPAVAEIWAANFRHPMVGNIVNELI